MTDIKRTWNTKTISNRPLRVFWYNVAVLCEWIPLGDPAKVKVTLLYIHADKVSKEEKAFNLGRYTGILSRLLKFYTGGKWILNMSLIKLTILGITYVLSWNTDKNSLISSPPFSCKELYSLVMKDWYLQHIIVMANI